MYITAYVFLAYLYSVPSCIVCTFGLTADEKTTNSHISSPTECLGVLIKDGI